MKEYSIILCNWRGYGKYAFLRKEPIFDKFVAELVEKGIEYKCKDNRVICECMVNLHKKDLEYFNTWLEENVG